MSVDNQALRESLLVTKIQQGDGYTKRARPTVVYAGLTFIFYNYCLVPTLQMLTGKVIAPFELPTEFWVGWTTIVGTWSIGRTIEKCGKPTRTTRAITGTSNDILSDIQ